MAKAVKITSPKGIAKFCFLSKPSTKFNEAGVYSTQLLLTPEEAKPLTDQIDKLVEESYKMAVDKAKPANKKKIKREFCYSEDVDEEGEPTGLVAVKFKKNASYKDKKTGETINTVVSFFDVHGNACPIPAALFSGSIIRVNANASPYFMQATQKAGITLYINGVQIIKANAGDGRAMGFEDEDADGFVENADTAGATNEEEDDDQF